MNHFERRPLSCLNSASNSTHESSSGMVDKNGNDDLAFRGYNLRFYRARVSLRHKNL